MHAPRGTLCAAALLLSGCRDRHFHEQVAFQFRAPRTRGRKPHDAFILRSGPDQGWFRECPPDLTRKHGGRQLLSVERRGDGTFARGWQLRQAARDPHAAYA